MKKEEIKPGWPPVMEPFIPGKTEYEGATFLEMLANATNARKAQLVNDLIRSIQDGRADASTWKMIKDALESVKSKSEKDRPIPILGGITQQETNKLDAIQSDNRPI